ncbi:MAG TPA: hypothetical protein VLX60_16045, partial [Terriglobales bacterium]|nr:hypothetical protein [Terriglobales bacterium]
RCVCQFHHFRNETLAAMKTRLARGENTAFRAVSENSMIITNVAVGIGPSRDRSSGLALGSGESAGAGQ